MMRKALKGSLAAAAGVAIALGASGTALAQDEDDVSTTATGTVVSEPGITLNGTIEGNSRNVAATMLGLQLGEGDARTVYCIQINVGLKDSAEHEERAWDDVPVEDLPKVLGVLLNGFNGSNAAELLEAAEVADYDLGEYTADQIAYAGTQAAVWSLTDNWDITTGDATVGGPEVDAAVLGLQTYLLETSEPAEEPDIEPYFEIDDSEAAVDGTTVGPYTVSTNFSSVTFSQPDGATIVDENGEEITEFNDGQTVYVEFDEAKSATVKVTTDTITWTTPVGRAFVPVDAEGAVLKGQNLILGESHEEEFAAQIEFEITVEEVPSESTSPAQPQLPVTGTSLTTVAGIGAAVLAVGVIAMVLMRRRTATAGGDWGEDEKE